MGDGVRLCSNTPARDGGRFCAIRNAVLARDACLGDAAVSLDEKARDLSGPRMFKPSADRALLSGALDTHRVLQLGESRRVPQTMWVPQSFAYFANDWAFDCGKTLDRTALDFQRPLLGLRPNRSGLSI